MEISEKMRKARLVFYEQDIDEINKILAEFLDRSQAKCALLIDKDQKPKFNPPTIEGVTQALIEEHFKPVSNDLFFD